MWVNMKMWVVFTSLWSAALGITCLNATGASVDWYAMYKVPTIKMSKKEIIKEGLAALYLDVHSPKWILLNERINDTQQVLSRTLSQIYNGKTGMMYIMYNDQPPKSQISFRGVRGHTKGVVAFDNSSGFWLIHSVPSFPAVKSKHFDFPERARPNGQSLFCVSFSYDQLGKVATQLWYNEPQIYDKDVPDSFIQAFPVLNNVIKGVSPTGPPYSSVLQLTSLGGQDFTSFAKSGKFGADLYDDLVAPRFKQNLLVKTWLSGRGTKLESNCTATYKVMTITYISLQAAGVTFNQTKDHSKWAISGSVGFGGEKVLKFHELEKWTCVGDINRMSSQFKRGGGAMCLLNPSVWQAYTNSVENYDKC